MICMRSEAPPPLGASSLTMSPMLLGRWRGDKATLHSVLQRQPVRTDNPAREDREPEGYFLSSSMQGGAGHQLPGEPGQRHQGTVSEGVDSRGCHPSLALSLAPWPGARYSYFIALSLALYITQNLYLVAQ